MIDMLAELNEQQREAAAIPGGPTLVIAGPGTGKTKTLVAHAAYLIGKRQVDPTQILILAFTKKNAQELQTRMQKEDRGHPKVSTFHALCFELIGRAVHIATDTERLQIIANLPKPAAYRGLSPRELALHFSKAKNSISESPIALRRLRHAYDKALEASGLIDFDDLLVHAYDLLSADTTVRSKTPFSHVLIDEFQDTNYLQYELVKLLCRGSNLFAIGDPDQSIYGFRGASGGIFDQFRSDFPKTKTITLTVNYRSCPEIVAVGNATFPKATALRANKTAPGRVHGIQVYNEYSEADWVLNQIQGAIGGSDMLRATDQDEAGGQRTLQDFAILYRNRSATTVLHKRIAESGLPYQIVGEGSPYEQPQVQAVIRILRSISNGQASGQLSGVSRQEEVISGLL